MNNQSDTARQKEQTIKNRLNLGCLHPVARVISYDVGFNPSTHRQRIRYQLSSPKVVIYFSA
jgi:hypothetical protein